MCFCPISIVSVYRIHRVEILLYDALLVTVWQIQIFSSENNVHIENMIMYTFGLPEAVLSKYFLAQQLYKRYSTPSQFCNIHEIYHMLLFCVGICVHVFFSKTVINWQRTETRSLLHIKAFSRTVIKRECYFINICWKNE